MLYNNKQTAFALITAYCVT